MAMKTKRRILDLSRELLECAGKNKFVETNTKGKKKLMETSKKSDGDLTADAFRVKELLLGSNFWRNSVSNIAERSGR